MLEETIKERESWEYEQRGSMEGAGSEEKTKLLKKMLSEVG